MSKTTVRRRSMITLGRRWCLLGRSQRTARYPTSRTRWGRFLPLGTSIWEAQMLGFNRSVKICAAVLAAAITLAGASSQAYAATGTVRVHIVKAGFIVGIGGGSGVLNFKGRNYRLSIGGINVGTIGASAVDLVGTATNLRTAADIVGTYTQGSAAIAIVGGGRVATLQNANGVVIRVRGPAIGLEASLSLSGMTISMQ